ncbi:MAG: 2-hydroxyacid dehydrogenase [Mycobacterium sp.]
MTPTGRVVVVDPLVDPETARQRLAGLDVMVTGPEDRGHPDTVALVLGSEHPLAATELATMPALRIIATTSAGTDHLPVAALHSAGIALATAGDYSTTEVADHTVALMLDLIRGISAQDRAMRRGEWPGLEAPAPRRIAGTRVGLIGFGKIAYEVARRAVALEMDVATHAPTADPERVRSVGAHQVPTLEHLLGWADIVSPHLPLTETTTGLLNRQRIAAMKPGAMLVNVSRGPIVEAQALVDALNCGHLAGAALDVFDTEPPAADDPLLTCEQVVLTPHVAWRSVSSQQLAVDRALDAVRDALGAQAR